MSDRRESTRGNGLQALCHGHLDTCTPSEKGAGPRDKRVCLSASESFRLDLDTWTPARLPRKAQARDRRFVCLRVNLFACTPSEKARAEGWTCVCLRANLFAWTWTPGHLACTCICFSLPPPPPLSHHHHHHHHGVSYNSSIKRHSSTSSYDTHVSSSSYETESVSQLQLLD